MMTMMIMSISVSMMMMMMMMERDIQGGFNLVLSRLADEDDDEYEDDDHDDYEYECEYDDDDDVGKRHTGRIQFSPVKGGVGLGGELFWYNLIFSAPKLPNSFIASLI